eukprot:9350683-Pyramimonas_sp.AAC.1
MQQRVSWAFQRPWALPRTEPAAALAPRTAAPVVPLHRPTASSPRRFRRAPRGAAGSHQRRRHRPLRQAIHG